MSGEGLADGPSNSSAHPHDAPQPIIEPPPETAFSAPPRSLIKAEVAGPTKTQKVTPRIVRRKPDDDESENAAKTTELMTSAPPGHSGKVVPGHSGKVVPKTRPRHSGQSTTPATVPGHSGQDVGQADSGHSGQRGQRVKEPADKDVPAPPTVAGYSWSRNGSGWSLRKRTPAGNRVYVARLGAVSLAELKRKHRTAAALEQALAEWAREREKEKGIA